jgi:hypothetical protein
MRRSPSHAAQRPRRSNDVPFGSHEAGLLGRTSAPDSRRRCDKEAFDSVFARGLERHLFLNALQKERVKRDAFRARDPSRMRASLEDRPRISLLAGSADRARKRWLCSRGGAAC